MRTASPEQQRPLAHPQVPRFSLQTPVQHGLAGEHAGPLGRPVVHEAASAARGTVIAMMKGMATSPARTIRRRDRSTADDGHSAAGWSSKPSSPISRSVRLTSAASTPVRLVMAAGVARSIDGGPHPNGRGIQAERTVRRLDVEKRFAVDLFGDEPMRPATRDEAAGVSHTMDDSTALRFGRLCDQGGAPTPMWVSSA